MSDLVLHALGGMPMVSPGDNLPNLLIEALDSNGVRLEPQDVLVVAQKIVSKAQNRFVLLDDVTPSERAIELGAQVEKDPRLVEVILSETSEVLRHRPGLLIVRHKLGFVMANAGVDQSNLGETSRAGQVLLLPENPDATCQQLCAALERHYAMPLGIIINDSAGRPWRNGIVGVALGVAGLPAVRDMCGRRDLAGRTLQVTFTGFADGIAAAAGLVMGEADEGVPAVVVHGLEWPAAEVSPIGLLRDPAEDLFL